VKTPVPTKRPGIINSWNAGPMCCRTDGPRQKNMDVDTRNLFTELADGRMHGMLAALNEGLPARERYAPLFALHDGGIIVCAACNGREVLFNAVTDVGGHPPGMCACWRAAALIVLIVTPVPPVQPTRQQRTDDAERQQQCQPNVRPVQKGERTLLQRGLVHLAPQFRNPIGNVPSRLEVAALLGGLKIPVQFFHLHLDHLVVLLFLSVSVQNPVVTVRQLYLKVPYDASIDGGVLLAQLGDE